MSGSILNAAPIPAFTQMNRIRVMRLYRRALKLQMSWTPRYDLFRSQAMEIRRRFEVNKDVSDPRQLQRLVDEAERELYENRHPDPYIPPTRPGGSKWERNIPPPRINPPNYKDFQGFQTYAEDQRPYWQILLDLPRKFLEFNRQLFFPRPDPTDRQFIASLVKVHHETMAHRNARVEEILTALNVPEKDKPTHRRWERMIWDAKKSYNEWDWDAQFADIEDSGDRQALYMACFETATEQPRLRRVRFHREALERVNRLDKDLPPVEKREFLAKEIAIAAAKGHIGDQHYKEILKGTSEPDGVAARDKLYKLLVVDFFIPHVEKFRGVVKKRDDDSLAEQTRWFWQPKEQLISKIDSLLQLCRLKRNFKDAEKAEWIYELYMAPKFYTEMERHPGAALEYVYWVQGKECVPEGYMSPDEEKWNKEDKLIGHAQKQLEDVKKSLRDDFEKKGYAGASSSSSS